jgi:hypothetical protein
MIFSFRFFLKDPLDVLRFTKILSRLVKISCCFKELYFPAVVKIYNGYLLVLFAFFEVQQKTALSIIAIAIHIRGRFGLLHVF